MRPDSRGQKKKKPSGLHFDPSGTLERNRRHNGDVINVDSKSTGKNGIAEIKWGFEGSYSKKSGMWPPNMTYEEVIEKTHEAWKYCMKWKIKPRLDPDTYNLIYRGYTKEGICVEIVIDLNGQAITSYPVKI